VERVDPAGLLSRFRKGDEKAAAEIFEQYVQRLTSLARSRLSAKLQRKVDAEDIVQSAYRSFFRAAAAGRYRVDRPNDLWSLLATITKRKVLRQAERFRSAKSSVDKEEEINGIPVEDVTGEPGPADVAVIVEELSLILGALTTLQRQMVELHLQGWEVDEIAVETCRSTRTVHRLLADVQGQLEARL
jgi:RNA polymerase sigma-70 factor, ECF subfamily